MLYTHILYTRHHHAYHPSHIPPPPPPNTHSFRLGHQEDAHEYLIALLDGMHECIVQRVRPRPSPAVEQTTVIYRIFGGMMRSQVSCVCGAVFECSAGFCVGGAVFLVYILQSCGM